MNLELSAEQVAFRDVARNLAAAEVAPKAAQIDASSEFDWALHRRLAELGFLGLTAPEEFGGQAADTVSWCVVVEEIAKASSTVSNGITLTDGMIHYISTLGTQEQKETFIPPLVRGESICSFALTEPDTGSDAGSVRTTARHEGDEVVLNGQKMFISGAAYADYFIVVATVDRELRHKGIRTYIVPRDAPGLAVGEKLDLMGIRGFGTSPVFFDDCRIPASNQLGGNEGFRVVMQGLDGPGRLGAASQALGLTQAAMEAAANYSLVRRQFGQQIFDHQAVQFMLADMSAEIEAARLLIWNAAWRRDAGLPFTKESSHAKLFAGDMCVRNVSNALQIFGGYGYSKEYPIERYYREAKIHQIWDGTNQIQRMIIARQLKKEIEAGAFL
ncbi:acyl-CoA dehydrogenase family protein [Ensifer aridi]|uniref:acyl-CoA dehydrogenase family protein n=1 Tax=Ensifer aridi TaxID=1708715 RepID=UPI00041405D4|nr:acyl-CoA dehydrogenase family protein [Ensifer aridi]